MPNHIISTMKLTFKDKEAKDAFLADFKAVENNLCATVMPYENIQPLDKDGSPPLGITSGKHWANMTMPDGSVVELTDLPWSAALWGTKWGTYDVEVYEIEDTYIAMDFNTAWSQIGKVCMEAIVKKYNFIEMSYTYYDEGLAFSGVITYDSGSKCLNLTGNPDICYE